MANKRIWCKYSQDFKSQAELELLEAILLTEVTYPWNPASPESEAYLTALEQAFAFDEWSGDEVSRGAQTLYAELEHLWSDMGQKGAIASIKASLHQRFAAYMPADALDAIAALAVDVLSANLSFADQLVQCVLQLLPDWAEEDLHVLARPLAYAMRGTESTPTNLPQSPWTELSEIERARLTLAVAHYALTNLQNYDK